MSAPTRGTVIVRVISASNLIAVDSNGKSDPYVIVCREGEKDKKKKFKTKTIKKTLTPTWNEEFKLKVSVQDKVQFCCMDWNLIGRDVKIGHAEVIVETLLNPPETVQRLTLDLKDVASGRLLVEMIFIDESLEAELGGLASTKFFKSVNAKMDRDYILIIDKSGSMISGNRWKEAQRAVEILAPSICKADPDGVTLYLFSDQYTKHTGITKSSQISAIFSKEQPDNSTNLSEVLKAAFEEHFSGHRETTILVVTDGAPDSRSEVEDEIKKASNRLQRDEDLSITFVQIGNDVSATKFLKKLDDELECKFDIVDTVTVEEMQGMSFEVLIEKSIND